MKAPVKAKQNEMAGSRRQPDDGGLGTSRAAADGTGVRSPREKGTDMEAPLTPRGVSLMGQPETAAKQPAGRRGREVPAYHVVVRGPADPSIRERVSRLHAECLVGQGQQEDLHDPSGPPASTIDQALEPAIRHSR